MQPTPIAHSTPIQGIQSTNQNKPCSILNPVRLQISILVRIKGIPQKNTGMPVTWRSLHIRYAT